MQAGGATVFPELGVTLWPKHVSRTSCVVVSSCTVSCAITQQLLCSADTHPVIVLLPLSSVKPSQLVPLP